MVPGASITIINDATNAERHGVSDSAGRYSLLQLQPGTYILTAKASGFTDLIIHNIHLLVNTPATLTVAFEKMGTVAETIVVTGEAVRGEHH